nr:MAG TPA: TFIIB Transcription factor zinc-finger [Caudoviricetes sp.]
MFFFFPLECRSCKGVWGGIFSLALSFCAHFSSAVSIVTLA